MNEEISKIDVINDISLLKAFREQQEISRQEVAEDIGVNERTIWAWETGTNRPNSISMTLICNWLGIDTDILNGEGSEEIPYIETIEDSCNAINATSKFLMNLDYSKSEIENLDIHNLEMTLNHDNFILESIEEMFAVKKAIGD